MAYPQQPVGGLTPQTTADDNPAYQEPSTDFNAPTTNYNPAYQQQSTDVNAPTANYNPAYQQQSTDVNAPTTNYNPAYQQQSTDVNAPTTNYNPAYQQQSTDVNAPTTNYNPAYQQQSTNVNAPTTNYNPAYQQQSTDFNAPMTDPTHYTRDPHRLTAYLVPFPKPVIQKGLLDAGVAREIPERFLIYTPPAPPLQAPKEGEKEEKIHKVQRKWQNEVREAKTNPQKVASWRGVKGRATKVLDYGIGKVTTSNLDFINRIPGTGSSSSKDKHADDGHEEGHETKKTVALEEMVMVYPESMHGTPEHIREEFVNSMLRTKSKAQRDSIIATGLLPVAFAVDILATLVWPFGGLAEIDAVWGASSIRGAKISRSVTKRINSSGQGNDANSQLRLTFVPSLRIQVLKNYLDAVCHDQDRVYFPTQGIKPTESAVLEAIGWSPSKAGANESNWEDEKWETTEVKDDFKSMMSKGAKEWDKWCKNFEKDPEKSLKK